MQKICFCASSGGHFKQLMQLAPIIDDNESVILTEQVAGQQNEGQHKTYYLEEINRRTLTPAQLIRNIKTAKQVLKAEKPDIIISTGALATVPICVLAKLKGIKIIYIESFAKVRSSTMTGKLMYRIADRFYVQWPQMLEVFPKAIYVGSLY